MYKGKKAKVIYSASTPEIVGKYGVITREFSGGWWEIRIDGNFYTVCESQLT